MADDVRGQVVADLRAEGDELDELVADLDAPTWRQPTPSPGWTIAHQIAHLAWTDAQALTAVREPGVFEQRAAELFAQIDSLDALMAEQADAPPGDLLTRWRRSRSELADALLEVPSGGRLPWYGPPMSATSMATARLMETWAHGLDVADALGVTREPTPRLRHVAHLATRTRDFSYLINDLEPPDAPFRVELRAPDGSTWAFGPPDAPQRVTGSALDLALLATQRRHRDDLDLAAQGPDAQRWLEIVQAFAGPPGQGRPPRTP